MSIFYTFEHLKRRLINVLNQLRFEVLPSVKTTDGPRFTSSSEKSGSEVLQKFLGRIFDCIQLLDICSIFIQAFISRFINVVFLLSEPLLLQPRHANTL